MAKSYEISWRNPNFNNRYSLFDIHHSAVGMVFTGWRHVLVFPDACESYFSIHVSRDNRFDHLAAHIRQTIVAAIVSIGKIGVIDA